MVVPIRLAITTRRSGVLTSPAAALAIPSPFAQPLLWWTRRGPHVNFIFEILPQQGLSVKRFRGERAEPLHPCAFPMHILYAPDAQSFRSIARRQTAD